MSLNWEMLRLVIGTFLLAVGIMIFIIEVFAVFRFQFVLNRMHAAALGDTLGIAFCLLGLMIFSGFSYTSLKMFLVILFLWMASPVSSHLIARLEVTTDEELYEYCTRGRGMEQAKDEAEELIEEIIEAEQKQEDGQEAENTRRFGEDPVGKE